MKKTLTPTERKLLTLLREWRDELAVAPFISINATPLTAVEPILSRIDALLTLEDLPDERNDPVERGGSETPGPSPADKRTPAV